MTDSISTKRIRKAIYPLLFLLFSVGLNSCEGLLDNCKICRLNTYEDDILILSQNEAEYCDDDLLWVQSQSDQVIGNTVSRWECD